MTIPVSLVNYGVGNLGSVRNMFKRIGVPTEDVSDPGALVHASRVLLPGVGAFDHGMRSLTDGGWVDALRAHAASGKPMLGICLGMQLLLESSEEGELPGFGFVAGSVKRFESGSGLRVPHMGWNHAAPAVDHPLFAGLGDDARFYFVHSYYAATVNDENVLARTEYGRTFASAVTAGNVSGVQFHPEKSHHYGMQLLENFSRL
ncbi:MAG: imidazole glycerol phosphate synthase subunit HisH [Leucobacter sp.]